MIPPIAVTKGNHYRYEAWWRTTRLYHVVVSSEYSFDKTLDTWKFPGSLYPNTWKLLCQRSRIQNFSLEIDYLNDSLLRAN